MDKNKHCNYVDELNSTFITAKGIICIYLQEQF